MAGLSRRIALIIAMNVLICVFAEEVKFYSGQYDNMDVEAEILNIKDMREAYYNCFMKKALCQTPKQEYLTGIFSEAYQTKCEKCTEKQKEMFKKVIEWYTKNEPEKWELILAKIAEDTKNKAGL